MIYHVNLKTSRQENRDNTTGVKLKNTKKDSRSEGDLRDTEDHSPYMVTRATDTQRQIPEILTGRIHSIPTLDRQESAHSIPLDTTLSVQEPGPPDVPQDPNKRLADVLPYMQTKPQ